MNNKMVSLQMRLSEELKEDIEKTAESFSLSVSEYMRIIHIISKKDSYEKGKLKQSAVDQICDCLTYFKSKVIEEFNQKNKNK